MQTWTRIINLISFLEIKIQLYGLYWPCLYHVYYTIEKKKKITARMPYWLQWPNIMYSLNSLFAAQFHLDPPFISVKRENKKQTVLYKNNHSLWVEAQAKVKWSHTLWYEQVIYLYWCKKQNKPNGTKNYIFPDTVSRYDLYFGMVIFENGTGNMWQYFEWQSKLIKL